MFDCNFLAWDFFVLKFYGILTLSYEEFYDFFVKNSLENLKCFRKLLTYLPKDIANRLVKLQKEHRCLSRLLYIDYIADKYNNGRCIPYFEKESYYKLQSLLGNVFSSRDGQKVTVNNITFKGTMQSIMLGNYEDSNSNWFNTELNNVNIVNTKVVSLAGGIAPAVVVYGNATLNSVNIYGTTRSELEEGPLWPVYDLAAVNSSNTNIDNSKIGTIYLWAKAKMTITNSTIDEIPFTPNTIGGLTIKGSTVNKVTVTDAVSKPSLTIGGSTIEVLDVTKAKTHQYITITSSTINKVLTAEGEMTLAQYQEWKQTH